MLTIAVLLPKLFYGQDNFSYSAINGLIANQRVYEEVDSVAFYIKMSPYENIFNSKDKDNKAVIDWYVWGVRELFQDTLTKYKKIITRRKIKKSFVCWDKANIKYNRIKDRITKDDFFFYYTCPIKLSPKLFTVIYFSHTKGGGVTAELYKYDNIDDTFKKAETHTMSRYGLHFR